MTMENFQNKNQYHTDIFFSYSQEGKQYCNQVKDKPYWTSYNI